MPKELLPQTIHCDAGRERIFLRHQPAGKIESRGALLGIGLVQCGENSRGGGFHFVARLVVGTAQHHEALTRVSPCP
jgi:hypothetical protein